ncbi:hypothetical protein HYT24_03300 [Candidatus Pacearchaeota archaeon]|nr:hypothetical protein [Candidatus Pacearchaeota archaeon]
MGLQKFLARNEKIIGTVASTLAIIMFISLLEVLMSNYRGESRIVIQPLATSLNGFVWLLYAYARKDVFIAIPNVLALVMGIATAAVVFV